MPAIDPNSLVNKVKTASIIDAMGRTLQQRAYILDLVTPTPGKILFGPALTISFLPYREDLYEPKHNFGSVFYKAIQNDPKDKVLVMATNGYPEISIGGGTKFSRLQNHGLAGILTDGRIRDFDEVKAYDFVTYCRGEAVHWGGDTIMPYAVNIPISVGGVTVVPGDYLFADDSGAAVIPASVLTAVFEEAIRVQEEDSRSIVSIREEDPAQVIGDGGSEENT
jgi:4-hydroxy-4-methyl-2-oxoglutarate aldolase